MDLALHLYGLLWLLQLEMPTTLWSKQMEISSVVLSGTRRLLFFTACCSCGYSFFCLYLCGSWKERAEFSPQISVRWLLFILCLLPGSRYQEAAPLGCRRTRGDIFTWGCIKVKNLNLTNHYRVYTTPSGKMLWKKKVEQLFSVLLECAHIMVMSVEWKKQYGKVNGNILENFPKTFWKRTTWQSKYHNTALDDSHLEQWGFTICWA